MKTDIHPEYFQAKVTCSCGTTFETGSTKKELRVEICSNCHPFYSGTQKFIDAGGRVDKFTKRYQAFNEVKAKEAEAAVKEVAPQVAAKKSAPDVKAKEETPAATAEETSEAIAEETKEASPEEASEEK